MKLTSKKKQEITFLLIAQTLLREYLIELETKELAIYTILQGLQSSLHFVLTPYRRYLLHYGDVANKMIDIATGNKQAVIYVPLFVSSCLSIWNEYHKQVFSQDLITGVFSYYENKLDRSEIKLNYQLAEKTYNTIKENVR